jgi:hypothetical protein
MWKDNFFERHKFENVLNETYTNTLVQNVLDPKHVIYDGSKSLTIAPREGFWPLWLFQLLW